MMSSVIVESAIFKIFLYPRSHTHQNTDTHTHTHQHIHTHTHAHTNQHRHVHTNTHAPTPTHLHAHTDTHRIRKLSQEGHLKACFDFKLRYSLMTYIDFGGPKRWGPIETGVQRANPLVCFHFCSLLTQMCMSFDIKQLYLGKSRPIPGRPRQRLHFKLTLTTKLPIQFALLRISVFCYASVYLMCLWI